MSDSVRPHRQQPTRLLCPWDSPGKNNGVGCHFLLQCMKVKSESEVSQSCPTLSDPMDCSLPGSSDLGIFQARVLEWVPLPSPRLSPTWRQLSKLIVTVTFNQICISSLYHPYCFTSFQHLLGLHCHVTFMSHLRLWKVYNMYYILSLSEQSQPYVF